jgi:hypothetical protein
MTESAEYRDDESYVLKQGRDGEWTMFADGVQAVPEVEAAHNGNGVIFVDVNTTFSGAISLPGDDALALTPEAAGILIDELQEAITEATAYQETYERTQALADAAKNADSPELIAEQIDEWAKDITDRDMTSTDGKSIIEGMRSVAADIRRKAKKCQKAT